MCNKRILSLLSLLFFVIVTANAQQSSLKIKVKNKSTGKELSQQELLIQELNKTIYTDSTGVAYVPEISQGKYTLVSSSSDFQPLIQKITIKNNEEKVVNIDLIPQVGQLEEITVFGRSKIQETNRQAYNVTAIDAKKLQNTTLDIAHALDRVSGVRVRENGGLGSSYNFSLNGFSGKQVKFFIDGIPMDNFGSTFQINNIPINIAERVEVYKGVVPIWLGSDALGGAVNIVSANRNPNFLDVSYSYGSFNTHKTNINAALTSKSGLTFQFNAYQNYSDNSYKVRVDAADILTGAYTENAIVKRFHDRYHNEVLVANVGVINKKYADRLLFGIQLGKSYQLIQTGARMVSVFGAWHRKGNMVMPTFKYFKKDLFVNGLTVTVNANINLGHEQNIDTAFRRYDWYGNYVQYDGEGSERSRSMYKYKNNNGSATATFGYDIDTHSSVVLNNVFTTFNRKGADELYPDQEKYELPQKAQKLTTGLAYKYSQANIWNATVFGKHFFQHTKYYTTYNPSGNWGDVAYRTQSNDYKRMGYGIAGTYFALPVLQIKASYEKARRLPENEELFGDMINQESNFNLKPETSDNFNFGASYELRFHQDHRIAVDANWIYRNSHDFIRARLNNNQSMLVMDNVGSVTNMGVDGEVRYSYKRLITAGVNLTYQNIRNNTKYEPGYTEVSITYKDRMPNIPYLFGNFDASLFLQNVGGKNNTLTFGYNVLYVHAYYLYWPSQGSSSSKYGIPQQTAHDANIVYSLKDGKYNVAFECKNIFDARLYDNFSLQKPSRSFNIKLRYFISK